jgi:hypothetical protein
MCQLPLILQGLRTAFQADDEGSIPFTRSTPSLFLIARDAPFMLAATAVALKPLLRDRESLPLL